MIVATGQSNGQKFLSVWLVVFELRPDDKILRRFFLAWPAVMRDEWEVFRGALGRVIDDHGAMVSEHSCGYSR